MRRATGTALAVSAAMLAGAVALDAKRAAVAHGDHQHHQAKAQAGPSAARVTLHDTQLVDANGQAVRFKSEAVDDRVVVVSFIYTSCTTICPVTSAVLADVQDRLAKSIGKRLGRDVQLISMSVDPVTDTPARLKEYAEGFGTSTGWLWLTGEKPDMDRALAGLGAYTPDFTDHPQAILVGDARTGNWTRFFGIPDPSDIVDHVNRLLAGRDGSQASAMGSKS